MTPKRIPWRHVRHHWEIYLFVLPTLITLGLFIYYPAASGIFHSFFRWNGADVAEPVGFGNYLDLLASSEFWRSFRNAFTLGVANAFKMVVALLAAVCIHRCRNDRLQYLYRLLFVIPMVIPPLVIALIWRSFFFEATNGYLNQFLEATNLFPVLNALAPLFGWGDAFAGGARPAWLGDPRLLMTAVIVWGFPWISSLAILTHLAKLQGISKDVYEAGDIDGIGWWSKFTRIELPLITGSIYLMLVFTIIGTIIDAGMIIALAGFEGGPGGKVDVPALFMLRKAFIDQKMGYACAVGIVLSAIVMTLQKLSTTVKDWESLGPLSRGVLRYGAAALGLGLLLRGAFLPVAFPLALFAVPWSALARLRENLADRLTGGRDGAWSDDRERQRILRGRHPTRRLMRRFGDVLLRANKHLFILTILALSLLPLYLMLVVSVKTNAQFYSDPAGVTQPMHWENWRTAWELITPTLANSVFISVLSTTLMIALALLAAYFFARQRMPLSGFLWNAILILMMMPMIANMVPLFRLLKDLHLLNTLTALILVGAAQGQIFAIFMLREFIQDIPQDLYEAADIDGAGHFAQLRTIVLPLSAPILGTVGVMHFMVAWNDFVLPLIVMRDHARLPVMVQLIRMVGEYIKLWGPLMAGYALAAIPIILLFMFSMKFFVRGMTDGAVKG
jgi:ABC-type glycerol-3-phosphate transport system permease component